MLPDAHAGCARLAVLPGRLVMRLRIAAHLCSRSVIWALRKAKPTLEAVRFEYKLASNVLRARLFVGIKWDICKFRSLAGAEGIGPKAFGVIDAAHFFINFPTLLFRKDQHNRTLVPYAFLAVFPRGDGSDVEICLLPLCFLRLRREPPQCLIVRTLRAQADFVQCLQPTLEC